MKNNLIKHTMFILSLVCLIATAGCNKDTALDVPNNSGITPEATWSAPTTADLFLNDIYASLPDMYGYNCFEPLENWTDNAVAGFDWSLSKAVIRDMATKLNASTDLVQWYGGASHYFDNWGALYSNIRKCNVFIENVAKSALPQEYKDKRLAEAHTLRAYFYQYLWMSFGGVPLISKPDVATKDGDAIYHARSTSDSTFAFIIADLDSAIALFKPNTGNDGNGRVNLGAALTIKGWVQLVYASKLHNPNNDKTRWAAAAATNLKVMQMGYSLYNNYGELFFATGTNNNEGIFYRQYEGKVKGSFLTQFQGPSHFGISPSKWASWGGSTPTQQLVDAYPMANGKAINAPGSGYNPQDPYANRGSRFYQSILYNGATYNGQPFYSFTGTYNNLSANNPIDLAGSTDYTNTGYSTKKRIDTTVNIFDWGATGQYAYYFRYAEVLLNYAEAQNEAVGPDASVYAALDQLRDRAHVPTITQVYPGISQDSMRSVIRRERRIELAFEDKRYWDLIRWKTAEIYLNQTTQGMKVAYQNGHWVYQVINAANGEHHFDAAKNYVLPIPQAAIDQNPKLKGHQNPNY